MPLRPKSDIGAKLREEALAVKTALAKEGLSVPEKPKFQVPEVPTRITDEDDQTLMNLFVRHTRWRGYLSGQLAMAEVDERFAEDLLTKLEAEALIRDWPGGREDRVTIAKAHRMADPAVVAATERLQLCYARRKIIQGIVEAADGNVKLISREITRRVGNEPTERRDRRFSP
jgi:hypothetical protein